MAVSTATAEPVSENKPRPAYGKVVLLLENSILPPEKLSPTPSMIDGLDPNSEIDLRILGCELIQTSGILLKLPQVAMATGQVLFHRFYYSKSFVRQAMEVVAMACITVASKIEESPRRIRDVVNVCHHIKQVRSGKTMQPLILDQNYINLKNQVIKAERRVLKELGFCVHVKHPHKIIVTLLQVLECEKNQKLIQTAWNYMNDSLRTDVFVRYQPENIACACIHLSARLLMIPLPMKPAWYSVFNVTEDEINDISRTILHLYCRKKPDAEKLEREVDELQKAHQEAKLKARGLSASSTPNANTSTAFSPSSQPCSPKKSPVVLEPKKENGSASAHSPKHEKESNHHHHHHHHHHHNHVSGSNSSGGSHKRKSTSGRTTSPAPVKRSNSSSSPSPKARKTKTPPRGYKEPLRSRSRSRSRERKEAQTTNASSKHRSSSSSHKRKRSRSRNRKSETHVRSPHRHSSKKYYKERSGNSRR